MTCNCKSDWRLEILNLGTGLRIGYLPFSSFTFQDSLNQVGPATCSVPLNKVSPSDIWPHQRAIAFTRLTGPGASATKPVCEFIGMIDSYPANSGGDLQIGMKSIDGYLEHRLIESNTTYTSIGQNDIGAALVSLASFNGINLTSSTSGVVNTARTRSYLAADDKFIMSAISELTEIDGGPDYIRRHTFSTGAWFTDLEFTDHAGSESPRPLNARRGLSAFGVNVDASTHANWGRFRGDGIVTTIDNTFGSDYPRFDAAVQWSDEKLSAALGQMANGYMAANSDPIAIPDVTVVDLNIAALYSLGDHIDLDMQKGAIRYKGEARLIAKSWSLSPESPPACTFSMVPVDNSVEAILMAPDRRTEGCC